MLLLKRNFNPPIGTCLVGPCGLSIGGQQTEKKIGKGRKKEFEAFCTTAMSRRGEGDDYYRGKYDLKDVDCYSNSNSMSEKP